MRKKLKKFIEYEEGEKIRNILHEEALRFYVPKHSKETYFRFMNKNTCAFHVNHPQSVNNPFYMSLFTVRSQWVQGDCVEECLDRAMEVMDNETSTE